MQLYAVSCPIQFRHESAVWQVICTVKSIDTTIHRRASTGVIMRMYRFAHHEPSTNGAPQVISVLFASLIPLMAFLPFAEIGLEGTMSPRLLINLIGTESGFNPFALLLFLAPPIGIAEGLIARSIWRGASALIAFLALVTMLLTYFVLSRQVNGMSDGSGFVRIGVAGYYLIFGYLVILGITGIAAFRARDRKRHQSDHSVAIQ